MEDNQLYYTILGKLEHLEKVTIFASKSIFTIDEAVLFTGLSKATIHRYTSEKRIPHFKRGGILYFKREELEAWMLEKKVEMK